MSDTWLVLDMGYLSWRSAHAFGSLSHRGVATGMTYGVFRDLISLQDQFATRNVVFCWDYGKKLKRQEVFPTYKEKRNPTKMDPDKLQAYLAVKREMRKIRDDHLPYLGYKNIFYQKGYEADDVIASVCQNIPRNDQAVIVTADQDLYQCINNFTYVWNPSKKKIYNPKTFKEEYGISPDQWVMVKAIAGCSSDQVPGISGVGEKTVCSYLTNKMPKDSKKRIEIKSWIGSKAYLRNLDLVRLPYTGTKDFEPIVDKLNVDNWKKLTTKLGMKSIVDQAPKPLDDTFKMPQVKIKRSGT